LTSYHQEIVGATFLAHPVEALGDRKPPPMQLIPQTSYSWPYPEVVKVLFKIPGSWPWYGSAPMWNSC